MTTKTDLRAISHLLGDALSQFAKLFQNEVDLAKAELGEKVQQIGGAVGLIAAGAVLVIPAIVMALVCAVRGLDRGRMVAAGLLSDLCDCCRGARRHLVCGRHEPARRTPSGAA